MTSKVVNADAVVVGAGTAGAGAALQLARRGLRVVLVDRRPPEAGGAQWHNGVLDRHFVRAGIEPPSGAERKAANVRTHIVGADGTKAITLTAPTVGADMALLGRRLRSGAVDAGAQVIDRAEVSSVTVDSGRVRAVEVRVGSGDGPGGDGRSRGEAVSERIRLEAPLFVDASGRGGSLRRHSPALDPWCPPVRGAELCSAADVHHAIADADGARRFLDRHAAQPGETVTFLGVAGGYSTVAIAVDADLHHVGVLVGCLADGRYGTGPRMVEDLLRTESWMGERISGGFGVIPLRRPYSRFTAPGLALVGDSACQVFPAHGSGIGLGLIAGRLLADAVGGADDPGHEEVLWRYQLAFQREFGGLLVASDIFRRLSTELGEEGVLALVRSGLMTESSTDGGLDQRWPEPPLSEVVTLAGRLARSPGLARRMLPRLARGQMAVRSGVTHPRTPDVAELTTWDGRVNRLLGRLPT